MGKKLDALFGRHFKASKFKALLNLAVSRLAILKNQRGARCSLSRSDVLQLLSLGHHDRALLRVEQVIKEQNILDVFVMIEGYCHLLAERINLIEQDKECPEELKEAVSSLLYAATRCGEFPELQEIRAMFTSRFGKDFATRAIELRNNCGVNPKMIQKMSTKQPSLENRLKVLKEIAYENNIVLQFEEPSSVATEEKLEIEQKQNKPKSSVISASSELGDDLHNLPDEMEGMEDSMKAARKYKDVADAAEAAFKSAAYAAAAARAAVELSRSESHDPDDDQNSPHPEHRKVADEHDVVKSILPVTEENNSRRAEDQNVALGFEKVHPVQNYNFESEDETHGEKKTEVLDKNAAEFKGSIPPLNSDSGENNLKGTRPPSYVLGKPRPMENQIFYKNDDETRNEQGGGALLSRTHDLGFDKKTSLINNEDLDSGQSCTIQNEDLSERNSTMLPLSQKKFPLRSQGGYKAESGPGNSKAQTAAGGRIQSANRLNTENKPISVRTRRAQGR